MKRKKSKILTKIAINLKRLREDKKLTIDELSEKSGINRSYLKKIENDDAPGLCLSKVTKIVSALDINYKDLFA